MKKELAEFFKSENFNNEYFFFTYFGISMLVLIAHYIKNFKEECCETCRRGYMMGLSTVTYGKSYTKAEFDTKEGHWEERNAEVTSTGGLYRANVTYDHYVPGTTEFKGVYKYTRKTFTHSCPICGKKKSSETESRDRIL